VVAWEEFQITTLPFLSPPSGLVLCPSTECEK
jgi:hypothetical protein